MLSIFSKAFAIGDAQESFKLKPRQINLSGEIISFSMPENFSSDMPAGDMVESVNLTDKSLFKEHQEISLIRRWWDLEGKGFLGKKYGTVMMSISVKESPENSKYDILEPLGFIGEIIKYYDGIEKNDNRKNDGEEPLTLYPNFYEAYKVEAINSLQWFSYPVEEKVTNEFIINYAIAITRQHYIVVSFSLSPSSSLSIRQFIEKYGRPHLNAIMGTFTIEFSPESNMSSINSRPFDLEKLITDKFQSEEEVKFIGFE